MRKKYTLLYIWLCIAALCFSACHKHIAYHHYEPITNAEWGREDTVTFSVPALEEGGYYDTQIELRANDSYPYQSLHMIVECEVLPQGRIFRDTLLCQMTDDKGHALGNGVCDQLCEVPYTTLHLQAGDSLHVSIFHHMRSEILTGIMDIGLLVRQEQIHKENNKTNKHHDNLHIIGRSSSSRQN